MKKHLTLTRWIGAASLFSAAVLFNAAAEEHRHGAAPGWEAPVGKVDFPVSCSPEAQRSFNRATALLHSFWYPEARKGYQKVAQIDPDCAMAHWGIAMSYYRPLWGPPKAEELLEGKKAIGESRRLGAKTVRERELINALTGFYESASPKRFELALEALHRKLPRDLEISAFYALMLDATASPTDKSYAQQKKAGKILEPLFERNPDHPGLAHYIIHSYDYPPLAHRALKAARHYAKVAPKVPHALHMPSHIFTRLGLWEESVRSNLDSAAAAKEYAARTQPGVTDLETLHALDYLEYAYLQLGQDAKAESVVSEIAAITRAADDYAAAFGLGAVQARKLLERAKWKEAKELKLPLQEYAWERWPTAAANVHFARAIGAARTGDASQAQAEIARLGELRALVKSPMPATWSGQIESQRLAASAWLAQAEGKGDEALRLMTSAAELEDSIEKDPVTPGAIRPARELLAELLLEQKKPALALAEFERTLKNAPNRLNSLAGAGRSARLAGIPSKAARYYGQVLDQTRGGNLEIPAVLEARSYLKDRGPIAHG